MAEEQYNRCSELTIGGKGIKGVPIQLTDLSAKEKRRYAVVAIKETFEGIVAHAREMYTAYPTHRESSYFDAAVIAYEKAMRHPDCPYDMLAALREEKDTMRSIRWGTNLIEAAEATARKIEIEKGFENPDVYRYLSAELLYIDRLLKVHPELEVLEPIRMDVVRRSQQHPQGKMRDGEETVIHQRETLSGRVSFSSKYASIPFNRMKVYACTSEKIKGEESRIIGKVNNDGTYKVVKPEGMSPLYVYVTGEKDKAHLVHPGMKEMNIVVTF